MQQKHLPSLFLILFLFAGCLFMSQTTRAQTADPNIIEIHNPLGDQNKTQPSETTISLLAGKIIQRALGIIGSITLVVFLYGGFMWLTSRGASEKVQAGTNAMLYAGIGLLVIFGSYAILSTILSGLGGS